MPSITKKISFPDNELVRALCGEQNAHLNLIQKKIGVSINLRGNVLLLQGGDWEVELAEKVFSQLYELLESGYPLYINDVAHAIRILSGDRSVNLKKIFKEQVYITSEKKIITPKTINQKKYIDSIKKYDIVFGIGPAGTGKTYLAMAMAVASLIRKDCSRIILARPRGGSGGAPRVFAGRSV